MFLLVLRAVGAIVPWCHRGAIAVVVRIHFNVLKQFFNIQVSLWHPNVELCLDEVRSTVGYVPDRPMVG